MSGGFDLTGAAHDLSDRAKRYAPILVAGGPDLAACQRLLYRNPWVAGAALAAIEAELAANPDRAVTLDQPLFDNQGQAIKREAV
jgi:hypothetical protein